MDENFKLLTRGSVILEWSPSGVRTRYVVQRRGTWGSAGVVYYDLIKIDEQDNLCVGTEQMDAQDIEEAEGFGSTFTYMLGEVYKLPDFL